MAVQRAADADYRELADELAQAWAGRDLLSMARETLATLGGGSATDWGLPASAVVSSGGSMVSFGSGIPDPRTLPRAELLAAMERALDVAEDDDTPLRYGGGLGYLRLRQQLADRYNRDRDVDVGPDHFMLTNGSAGAIEAVCAAFLQPGDVVICEAPTFSGTLRTFRGYNAKVIPVYMDEQGLRTDDLDHVFKQVEADGHRVKFVYTIANFQNPTGLSMSLERREDLLRIAARHGTFVLDDDAYGELYFGDVAPRALSALSGGYGVITVGSFSKTIATGLRAGWVHAQPEVIELLARVRFDMGSSPLMHYMLAEYIDGGRLDRHVHAMRDLYGRKMDILASALTELAEPYLTFQRPRGGFFLWLKLRQGLTAAAVQRASIDEGVFFPVGHAFFPDRHDPEGEHIRLAFAWTALDDLRSGAERLAGALERVAAQS